MRTSIKALIKLCSIKKNSSDTETYPSSQIQYLGSVADAVQIQPYGLTSRPPDTKSMGVMFNIQAQEQNRMFIAFCSKLRKRGLKAGETVLENMLSGGYLHLKSDGTLEINIPKDLVETVKNINVTSSGNVTLSAASGTVTVTAAAVVVTSASVVTTGSVKAGTGLGCNGKTPQASVTLPTNAVNDATSYALNNAIKALLIANGMAQ